MTTILIKPIDFTKNTILSGNIDIDKFLPINKLVQDTMIKPLLGNDLYQKLQDDYEANTLTGLYLELYDDYIKPMIIHGSAEHYIVQGAYRVSNGGIFKGKSDDSETISKEEVDYLVQSSRKVYYTYKRAFDTWISTNGENIPEYTITCATKNVNYGGWILTKKRQSPNW